MIRYTAIIFLLILSLTQTIGCKKDKQNLSLLTNDATKPISISYTGELFVMSSIQFKIDGEENRNVKWHFSDTTSDTGKTCTHMFRKAGLYKIIVEGINTDNIRKYDTIEVAITAPYITKIINKRHWYWQFINHTPLLDTTMTSQDTVFNLSLFNDSTVVLPMFSHHVKLDKFENGAFIFSYYAHYSNGYIEYYYQNDSISVTELYGPSYWLYHTK